MCSTKREETERTGELIYTSPPCQSWRLRTAKATSYLYLFVVFLVLHGFLISGEKLGFLLLVFLFFGSLSIIWFKISASLFLSQHFKIFSNGICHLEHFTPFSYCGTKPPEIFSQFLSLEKYFLLWDQIVDFERRREGKHLIIKVHEKGLKEGKNSVSFVIFHQKRIENGEEALTRLVNELEKHGIKEQATYSQSK